jgi:glycosyltransferase involved in cell wall biosynthesis
MNSLVSICIPTFNGSKFLEEALVSIESQTYKNYEVVISDDASTDETLKIIQDFKVKASFPVYIYHHEPKGIGANWNNCIRKANGEFIKFLFQDDVLLPSCIEEQLAVLSSYSNIGLVASKRKFLIEGKVDLELKEWIETYNDLQEKLELPSGKVSIITKNLFKDNKFLKSPLNKIGEPPTVFFRKSVVQEIGYFREDLHQILDYEFYYRLLRSYNIAIINKRLVNFRLHQLQATNVNRNKPIKDYEIYERILFEDFFWYLNFSEKKRLFFKFTRIGKIIQRLENAIKRRL